MALLLIGGLRSGVGTTTLAANLAVALAASGRSSVLLNLSRCSTLGLHFGLSADQPLPGFDAPAAATGPINGVLLLDATVQGQTGDLGEGLSSGDFSFKGETIHIVDLSGADDGVAAQLRPHADLELCVLVPNAECLYSLPATLEVLPESAVFLLNRVDDTRRLGRHAASFVRELLGDRLIGAIQADEAVGEAAAMMQPLSRYAPSSAALADIAALANRLASLPMHQQTGAHDPASRSDAA
ncbi:MinD-like ATPase involved in chromosome partitioning or flagellar assembly [Novosphingobium hassiacum]|uniref:MinD-like ATPase involved in chromosome partitioning or flagellar assembly n=1 Tax=Novosphingobium hassiacum TaxID=173676 RepID=A0A7W5ZXJ1_9SPHN|nr:cellulose synthase operon protein YhjQ/BcsQ [Novosphingobium hassiacum]MBB3859987.1 MinD-like ATPase involved in chromosome partitioning or flagellar assembly [Novosphingobium hassiacum]